MKQSLLLFLLTLFLCKLNAQNSVTSHSLFTTLPNYEVDKYSVEQKEFDQLKVIFADKTKADKVRYEDKEGALEKMTFKWLGTWDAKPGNLQILNNFKNAVKQKGGEQVYYDDFYKDKVYFKLKQGGNTYWILVTADGIGNYTITSVKEQAMKQDVVMTIDDIKNSLDAEGKVLFYGIYFDTDKATIKPESAETLKAIAGYLKANPVNVFIVGHTDNTGSFDHNLALSKERAASVANELTTKYAVNKAQVTAQGVGSLSPVASNKSEEGKSKNRRVEIVLK
ncbi:OmpA family protein [Pseudoflavitalea sp. G-6-1-2]|uniref:OmpA family protein n=1 Tax=Pseudoflavitalea sp. G-6-1-2 TaxID=2728841 RepID=UPI00146B55FA|nr:OmpA family protein [Pseudoflavitalea sp. G-6-1-2]NML22068.1 OmpA family protein [Pseudoflavitalea sp. G-6-1-2]